MRGLVPYGDGLPIALWVVVAMNLLYFRCWSAGPTDLECAGGPSVIELVVDTPKVGLEVVAFTLKHMDRLLCWICRMALGSLY